MATRQQYEDAARKTPKDRSPHEQHLVEKGIRAGMQSVKNFDHDTQRRQRYLF